MPSAVTKASPPSRPRRPSEADKLAQANKTGPALRRPMRGPLPPLPAAKPQPTVPLPSVPSPEHSPSAEAADAPLLAQPAQLHRKPSKTRAMLQAFSSRNRSHQRPVEPQEELETHPTPPPTSFTPAHTPSASRELKPLLLAIHASPSGASKTSALKPSASHLAPPTLRARRFSRNTAGSYGSLSSRYDTDASQNASPGLSSSEDSGDESEASLSLASQNFHAANPFDLSPLIIEDSALEPGSPLPTIETDDSLVHRVSGGLRGSKDALLFDVASPTSPRPAGTPARAGFLASLSPDHRAHYLARHAAAGAGRTHRHAPSSVSESSCASSLEHSFLHREDLLDDDASTQSRASTPELVASHRPSMHLTTPTPATVAKGFGAAQAEHKLGREFDEALSRWARAVPTAACP
jgi:hypothetical protein